jgi:hypothetical protein
MRFKANFNYISIDNFLEKTIENTSNSGAQEVKEYLKEFKARKIKGELCHCGNEIWIIGSAYSGKGCFSCITGETDCSDDYEIE